MMRTYACKSVQLPEVEYLDHDGLVEGQVGRRQCRARVSGQDNCQRPRGLTRHAGHHVGKIGDR